MLSLKCDREITPSGAKETLCRRRGKAVRAAGLRQTVLYSAGCDVVVVIVNTHQLRLPAQDLRVGEECAGKLRQASRSRGAQEGIVEDSCAHNTL